MFFDIFSISLAVILYVDINFWEEYANFNLIKNNIVMTFLKKRDTNSMFRNYICISTKYKIHDCHRVTYKMIAATCEYPADDVRESSSWPSELVISFFHQFELRAVNSPVTFEQIANSLFTLLRSKSKFTQKLSNSSWFQLKKRYIQVKKIFFTLWANFCH